MKDVFFTKPEASALVGRNVVIQTAFPSPKLKPGVTGKIERVVPSLMGSNAGDYSVIVEWPAINRSDELIKSDMDHLRFLT